MEKDAATIATIRKPSLQSQRRESREAWPRRERLGIFTERGERIGLLLKVTEKKVKVRLQGPDGQVVWLPCSNDSFGKQVTIPRGSFSIAGMPPSKISPEPRYSGTWT